MPLDEKNLATKYRDAISQAEANSRHADFYEFGRIALGYPSSDVPEGVGLTTDGTTTTIVHEIPLQAIPEVPTCSIECADPFLQIMTEYYMNEIVLKKMFDGGRFHNKIRRWLRNACTYGMQYAEMTIFQQDGKAYPDFRLPYMGMVYLDMAAEHALNANYVFIENYYSPDEVDNIIATEQEANLGIWNVDKLREAKETAVSQATNKLSYGRNKSLGQNTAGFVMIVKAITKTKNGGKVFYFVPNTNNDADIVGQSDLSRFGGMFPLIPLYYNEPEGMAYGQGVCERTIDDQTTADAFKSQLNRLRLLQLQPPWLVSELNRDTISLEPNAVIEATAAAQRPDMRPLNFENNTLITGNDILVGHNQNIYSAIGVTNSNQIVRGAETTASKTPAGVQAQQVKLDMILGNIYEQVVAGVTELFRQAVTLLFYYRKTDEEVEIDMSTLKKLQRDAPNDAKKYRVHKNGDPRIYMKIPFSEQNRRDLVSRAYMKANPEFGTEKAAKAESWLRFWDILQKEPNLGKVVSLRKVLAKTFDGFGLDFESVTFDTEEQAQLEIIFPEALVQEVRRIISQEFGTQTTYSKLDPNQMPADWRKQLAQQLTGIQAIGKMPDEQTLELKDKELDIKREENLQDYNVQMAKISQQATQAGSNTPQQGASQPANQPETPSAAPAGEDEPTPKPVSEWTDADFNANFDRLLAQAQASGATEDQIAELTNLFASLKLNPEDDKLQQQLADLMETIDAPST